MQSLFGGGELGLLGGGSGGGGGNTGTLKEDGCGSVAWNSSTLAPEDVYSASHFALITAYQDIKTRLACLERENTSIKRKLKMYEIKVRAGARLSVALLLQLFFFFCKLIMAVVFSVLAAVRREGLRCGREQGCRGWLIYWKRFRKARELRTQPWRSPSLLRAARLYTKMKGEKAAAGFDPGAGGETNTTTEVGNARRETCVKGLNNEQRGHEGVLSFSGTFLFVSTQFTPAGLVNYLAGNGLGGWILPC